MALVWLGTVYSQLWPESLVELEGLEPSTSSMPLKRSPS